MCALDRIAPIAQLAEQRFRKAQVTGSMPVGSFMLDGDGCGWGHPLAGGQNLIGCPLGMDGWPARAGGETPGNGAEDARDCLLGVLMVPAGFESPPVHF